MEEDSVPASDAALADGAVPTLRAATDVAAATAPFALSALLDERRAVRAAEPSGLIPCGRGISEDATERGELAGLLPCEEVRERERGGVDDDAGGRSLEDGDGDAVFGMDDIGRSSDALTSLDGPAEDRTPASAGGVTEEAGEGAGMDGEVTAGRLLLVVAALAEEAIFEPVLITEAVAVVAAAFFPADGGAEGL